MSTHIFEPITDRFGYGNYLSTKIIIDKETGYINATKLCAEESKYLYHWHAIDSSRKLLEHWQKHCSTGLRGAKYEVHSKDIDTKNKTHIDVIKGTYYHEDIVIQIAQWISPVFAIKVSHIIKEYISRENNRTIRELKGENKTLLDKVDDQTKEIKNLTKQNNELLAATRTIIDMNHDQNTTLKKQDRKLDVLTEEVNRIRRHLDNSEVHENKREAIIVYRLEHDDMSTIRIRCGTNEYLSKFRYKARWYKEYDLISNSKRALNYLKSLGYLNKQTDAKFHIDDRDHRIKLLKMLKKVNDSYK